MNHEKSGCWLNERRMFIPKEMQAFTVARQCHIPGPAIICCAKDRCTLLLPRPSHAPWWQGRSHPGSQYYDPNSLHTTDICPTPIGRCPKAGTSLAHKLPQSFQCGFVYKQHSSVYSRWSPQTTSPTGRKWVALREGNLPRECAEPRLQPDDFTRCS